MSLKIKTIIGATQRDIEDKQFNIFLPISLGNKWFTKENIEKYISWSLNNTKADIIIIIADKLHQINVEVKDHYNPEKARRRVERIANKIELEIKETLTVLPKEAQDKIKILRWENIDKEKKHEFIRKEIYKEFEKNKKFKESVIDITKDGIKKIKSRTFTEEEIIKLSQYVINELPIFLYGVNYNNKYYNPHPYPVFTKIFDLVDKIQKEEFSQFYYKIGKPRGAIVELS